MSNKAMKGIREEEVCTLYIARHGETEWNREKRLQGHADSPLTDSGICQAKQLGEKLAHVPFDAVFTSDVARTLHTAKYALLNRDIAIQTTNLLRERTFGRWEGYTYDEYNKKLQIDFDKINAMTPEEKWVYKPHSDVESDEEIVGRFLTFLRETSVLYAGKTVLVISHGGILRVSLIHLGFATASQLPMGAIDNAGYFVVKSDGADIAIVKTDGITLK